MGPLSTCLLQLLFVVFHLAISSADATKTNCPISFDIRELEKYFGKIKENVHNKDIITDVNLLKTNELKQIKSSEACCFLLRLGHFYTSIVFPQVESTSIKQNQDFTHLANSILGIYKKLKECNRTFRCPCGAQSQMIVKNFKDEYLQMESESAAIKAIGEMNTLFHWMEKNYLN